jgi:hypothetical protein
MRRPAILRMALVAETFGASSATSLGCWRRKGLSKRAGFARLRGKHRDPPQRAADDGGIDEAIRVRPYPIDPRALDAQQARSPC